MGSPARESVVSLSAPSIHDLIPASRRSSSLTEDSTLDTNDMLGPEYRIDRGRNPKLVLPGVKKKGVKSRMSVSADNSPVLSRRMKSHDIDGKSALHKKLLPNMDKFDISIDCPDGETYKASVFKVWTAFQLSWKIAHVKGMAEKIALIVREYITQLHLVRSIEDHECVHDVIQNWAPGSSNALKMVSDYGKFDLFHKPANYLPLELLDVEYRSMLKDLGTQDMSSTRHNLISFIVKADTSVDLHNWILMKDFDKKTWTHRYLRIKDSIIYLCANETEDSNEWTVLYNCKHSYLYCCLDEFSTVHKPPNKYCFCIIPSVVNKWKQIKCFSVESETLYTGWMTGFRLAKYGQQLFKNFCEAMTKEENLCRANSSHQSMFFHRGRRASEIGLSTDNKATLDFSGDNARVISDPLERMQIHNQLGLEIPRPPKRRSETFSPMTFRRAVLSQKVWYHGKVKREHAILKLKKNGMKEGMFLVRESSSCHGNLVLSVVRKGKIAHHQIFEEVTKEEGKPMYGMQHGPQFDSLEHLIVAYNSGNIEAADFVLKKPCPPT